MSNGKIWPYVISIAILTFFGAIVFSVTYIVKTAPVEKSHAFMMDYDNADLAANEIIQNSIDFNKKYKVSYITEVLSQESTILKYKITDIKGKAINTAKLVALITRPNHHKHNQELINPKIENGIYTFNSVMLAEPGRWNIMTKITIGENKRFYNVKADTRAKEAFEY